MKNTLLGRTVKKAATENKKGIQNFSEEEDKRRDSQAKRTHL